jgi:iron complex outermembrane receptor protein
LTDRNVQHLDEALLYSPGVNSDQYGPDTRTTWFEIRGFDADLYLDGLRLPNSLTNLYAQYVVPAYGLERVDILRGPSSVMYGAGNQGGS